MLGQQVRQHVVAVEQHPAHPREVVEPDLVDDHARAVRRRAAGKLTLEADRDVAQPDGAVAGVEEGASDDADRVREVDDPGPGAAERSRSLGDLEHDRHGAHRLREAAGAGRLLTDAAAARAATVSSCSRASWPPTRIWIRT